MITFWTFNIIFWIFIILLVWFHSKKVQANLFCYFTIFPYTICYLDIFYHSTVCTGLNFCEHVVFAKGSNQIKVTLISPVPCFAALNWLAFRETFIYMLSKSCLQYKSSQNVVNSHGCLIDYRLKIKTGPFIWNSSQSKASKFPWRINK